MICEIIKISKKRSKYGGYFYLVCFKSDTGKSYITYVYEKMRNYHRWSKVLNKGVVLAGLKLVRGKRNIVDADSRFTVIKE